jgi:hypothetical protein
MASVVSIVLDVSRVAGVEPFRRDAHQRLWFVWDNPQGDRRSANTNRIGTASCLGMLAELALLLDVGSPRARRQYYLSRYEYPTIGSFKEQASFLLG